MYDEKIRYSHSYINHSNRALRPLNMYLNVRRAPASFLNFLPLPAALRPAPGPLKAQPAARRPSQGRASHSSSLVMAQIPPSQNPRGELIFSSRVDHHFEEGYKRYRAAFERRREERSREEARAQGKWWHPSYWQRLGGTTPPQSLRGTPPPGLRQSSPPASPRRRKDAAAAGESDTTRRERAESYSFVFAPPPSEAVGAKAARG
ncbi:hypothetical protein VHUM_02091 [Vanrija humicola]|uniref:Transmembrane protein 188 n=1 Tax=Vanrija humicola TaxID=5417 RepID=A0A7D8V1P1_VANHU|nr:hypothetical protein VHUM_02091 [Vanrija humicola]